MPEQIRYSCDRRGRRLAFYRTAGGKWKRIRLVVAQVMLMTGQAKRVHWPPEALEGVTHER